MYVKKLISKVFIMIFIGGYIFAMSPLNTINNINTASAGSFNSNLLQLDSLTPAMTADKKTVVTDVPMLSFLPYKSGNPRTIQSKISDIIGFQVYFNNGGNSPIENPTLKTEILKENSTKYRIRATLLGTDKASGATVSAVSALKGDDLIITTPENADINLVGNSTRIYRNAFTEYPDYPNNLSYTDSSSIITDTTDNSVLSNPIFSTFADKDISSDSDYSYKIADSIEPTGTNYGFITSKILVTTKSNSQNIKPSLDDQQLTIPRGVGLSFKPYACSDADNNFPCNYKIDGLPDYCKNEATTNIISCKSDSNTPSESTFNITPIDSLGLAGNIANFTINVVDPNSPSITAIYSCYKSETNQSCDKININKGDILTFKTTLLALGKSPVTNIKMLYSFDKDKVADFIDLNVKGDVDSNSGKILVNIGNMNPNDTKEVTFKAKILDNVKNGEKLINKLAVTSENTSVQNTQNSFTINLPGQQNLSTSFVSCNKKGTSVSCDQTLLNPGDVVTYKIKLLNTGGGPAYNVKVANILNKGVFENISDINASGIFDPASEKVTWIVGSLNAGETKELFFDAKISQNVKTGDQIISTATVTADNYPDQSPTLSFVLLSSNNSPESPRTGGFVIWTLVLVISTTFAAYIMRKNVKLKQSFTPERSKELSE